MSDYKINFSGITFGKAAKKSSNRRAIEKNTTIFQSDMEDYMYWEDVAATAGIYPEHTDHAQAAIKVMLGYLPHPECLMKFEPAVRAISHLAKSGTIQSQTELYDTLEDHIKPMRNFEMKPIARRELCTQKLKYYYDSFQPYGQIVKDRLTYLLGFDPQVEYSLEVELNMRDFMKKDLNVFTGNVTQWDHKAIVAIYYMHTLVHEGWEAANNSPLIGMNMRHFFENEPKAQTQ